MGLTERYVCISNFWENAVLDDFQKHFHANILAFLQGLYLALSAFKDYIKSLTIGLGLGKNNVTAKKDN